LGRKKVLPDDLKMQCIGMVRGYDRRVVLYHERRNAVLYASPAPVIERYRDGQEGKRRGESKSGKKVEPWEYAGTLVPRGNALHDPTASKAELLESIEQLPDTKMMRAVEQAKFVIGVDCDEEIRQALAAAIWDCCIYGRNFKFQHYDLPMDKATFYDRRARFLRNIALNMNFL